MAIINCHRMNFKANSLARDGSEIIDERRETISSEVAIKDESRKHGLMGNVGLMLVRDRIGVLNATAVARGEGESVSLTGAEQNEMLKA